MQAKLFAARVQCFVCQKLLPVPSIGKKSMSHQCPEGIIQCYDNPVVLQGLLAWQITFIGRGKSLAALPRIYHAVLRL